MLRRKSVKKLTLNAETLRHITDGNVSVQEGSISSPGCTVLSTCSPECCKTATEETN